MTDHKAMPDDYIKGWAAGAAHEWRELRAHIAAQAEKIAELEAAAGEKQRELNGWQAKYWMLEAENKRLREALNTCEGRILNAQIGINTGDTKAALSKYLDAVIAIIRKALAQPEQTSALAKS